MYLLVCKVESLELIYTCSPTQALSCAHAIIDDLYTCKDTHTSTKVINYCVRAGESLGTSLLHMYSCTCKGNL